MKIPVPVSIQKICAFAMICLLEITAVSCPVQAREAEYEFTDTLYARAAVLMDAESGRILYGKNENERLPMASTTKILTCILALEKGDPEELVQVSAYAASMPKVKLYMKEGERYRLGDLLYSLMLESHNDTAVAIAEHIGGSMEQFAILMNEKAQEIGCTRSFFITPNGLDATATVQTSEGNIFREHTTTAAELARIMAYCICFSPKRDAFLEITQKAEYHFTNQSMDENQIVMPGTRSFSCHNHNAFLTMMEGAISGKTGFTGKAGYCYVGAVESEERTFIVALLACGWPNNKTYKWSDTKKLMQYGMSNYVTDTVEEYLVPEARLKEVTVFNGCSERLGQTLKQSVGIEDQKPDTMPEAVLLRKDETIGYEIHQTAVFSAPIHRGQKAGYIEYFIWSAEKKKLPLFRQQIILLDSVDEISFSWCIEQVLLRFVKIL